MIAVAPESDPMTLSPTFELLIVPEAFFSFVNIFISKRYKPVLSFVVPKLSTCLTLAKPIWSSLFNVPATAVTLGNNLHIANGVIALAPLSLPKSGNPKPFLIFTNCPNLVGVFAVFNSTVCLAFLILRFEVPILSISYPLTYAFPGDTWNTNLDSSPPCALR